MTHTILIQRQADLPDPDTLRVDQLERAALRVLEQANLPYAAMLSLIISTDEYIQELNLKFRGIDAPTDILSFPAEPLPPEIQAAEPDRYLGDVIIGLLYTARRALAEGHSIHDELMLLVVHGTLHLLGYDHDTPEHQAEMWKLQAEALQALTVKLEVPDYIHES